MAGARTVDYIFQLIDKFSPVAQQLARAAQNAERTIAGMGRASNQVEASQRGAANAIAAMNRRALEANPALKNATDRLRAYGAAGERAAAQVRTLTQAQLALTKLEKEAALQRRFGGGVVGPMSRGDYRDRAIGHAGAAMMGGYVSDMLSRSMANFLGDANHEFFNKTRMGFVGFKGGLLKEADMAAEALSKKYKNMSKGDVLEQLYEGVSIHGDAAHALHYVENQTKLASFLQAFQDGKHGGRSHEWNREVFAAIKSMEMYGVLNTKDEAQKGKDIEGYLGSMMAMKALYGDQAKLTEYLTLQRRAGTSFRMFDENFRLNVLPALVQEVGGATTGQQAMTAYQSIVAGVKITQKQMDMMDTYGLLDKKGKRFTRAAGDLYANDPTLFAADLKERAARKFKMSVDDERLIPLLRRDISSLFPNRNAASFIDNLIANNVNIHKHVEAMKLARKEMDAIAKGEFFAAKTKAGAEGSVSAQWKNMMAALGGPMMQPYIDRMNAWAKSLNWVSAAVNNFSKSNPALAGMIGKGAVIGAGTLATLAMAATVGFGLAALRSGIGFLFAGGAMGTGGAVAARAAMAAAPLAMGMGTLAAAGTAGAVVARTGLLTRAFQGLLATLTFGAMGVNKFHLAANGMGAGLAAVGRVLWSTTVAGGLSLAWMNRDKIGAALKYVKTVFDDIGNVLMSIHKHRLGSRERKASTKRLLEDVMGVDLTKITTPDVLNAPQKMYEGARKSLRDSGWMSYLRWQSYEDQWRLPYGERPEMEAMVRAMGGRGRIDGDNARDFAEQQAGYLKGLNVGGMNSYGGYVGADNYATPHGQHATAGYFMPPDFNSAPTSERDKEISVQSFVTVSIPPSVPIQVNVSGTINGSVTGSGTGAIQFKADAPRGESAAVPKLPNGLSRQ